ncbi:tRNA 4-thiouridine(8) synthase ThiI [Mycoplasma capricolum subsp. capripneumoniae]|uniref:Probable tRNA sulfurtransferase n=1 Tax=Mycoplasma capricolum subsp. capripneumoniae 87001 TaxID=1124992 RepID=A0A9N7G8G8_MYCCC|nr:tRNA uracil 4-sulfurtransferase ThiI [Mycoplasma capricolum]AJK51275.1 thiamine biosynthesis protein ThiI [Mycoplasma capricolum subsp. capripneumoniae 87001]AOQ21987.1 tRNA 4-thiouridine(8) synthase ThiI [Mycoplasma capricolum subsp. capripneumoniae M1601]KEY84287.1 Thiamine biosynthesis/tRNA modification protein [Mycoplasma capricolum subsp. capripneumoniae 99108]QDL19470.1 tRNA 4-thiouridine(8) synthase ThiI [Mycoplasma capricolum subsp. capripneumoniae]QDL20155.1 tRNA 4-thiouridine(8) s
MKYILIRYGELTLKGNNRFQFIDKLISNIKFKLKQFNKEDIKFIKDHNSLTLEIKDELEADVLDQLKTIFGIYSISIINYVSKDLDQIKKAVLEIAKNSKAKTFKLEVSRKDKSFNYTSIELKHILASEILKNTNHLIVDIHNPELVIEIVVKKDHVDVFDNRIDGLKGLPVGISDKGLCLLSGGIDSPVSAFLTLKRGMQVDFIHFMTPPHTSHQALDKVFSLARQLAKYNISNFKLHICNFNLLLQELQHLIDPSYKITIMRRMFLRIANIIAKNNNNKAIITGESLGQVASQTIQSINVINNVSDLPILRPVITYDKEEIIKIAKFIDTYQTSILPFDDVCSMFVPKDPIIKPKLNIATKLEENIFWNELLEETIKNNIKTFVYKNGEFVEE